MQAGNSVTVNVIEEIAKRIQIKCNYFKGDN